jgi:HK97 family phage portal protein
MFIFANERGPTDDFWYEPVDRSLSGKRVTPETSLKLSAFWSCAIVKAQTMAQLPLNLYRELERGKDKAKDVDLWRLIHNRPNRYQTSYQWREMGQLHLDLRGNFYNYKVFDRRGRIMALIPIHPDMVEIERLTQTSHRYLIQQEDGGQKRYTMDEIMHIAGPTLDGPEGLNPIEFHRETIGKSIATRDYGSEFYRNGATMPGWIEYPSRLDQEKRAQLRDAWQGAQTGSNRFKTPVLDRGMQYHELGLKHTDMQYLESLKNEDIVISQIMRVPPYKIYRMDQAKFNNVEHMEIDFVRNTLIPIARRWEQSMDAQLLDEDESTSLFFKFEVNGLLRGDNETRAEFYAKALGSGGHHPWMTPNEVRELEDRNPMEGGDELAQPKNSQQPENERLEAFLRASAERCVTALVNRTRTALEDTRPIADWSQQFFDKHAEFVANVMQIEPHQARAYCVDRELELLASDNPGGVVDAWENTAADELMEIAR